MSDLRTEMQKVMNQWDGVNMDTNEQYKSFGEKLFEYVKDHPYATVGEVEIAMGVSKENYVSSQLKTLVDRGILGREKKPRLNYCGVGSRFNWAYFAVHDKYETLNPGYWKPKAKKPEPLRKVGRPKLERHEVVAPREEVGIKDLMTPRPHREAISQDQMYKHNPATFVSNLTMREARALYDALKVCFGD